MGSFILRRLAHAVPLLIAVVVLNFLLIAFTPGDPILLLVGDFPAPPEYLARMRREFGLDQPVWIQLWRYLAKVVQGDFGFSFANQQPVATLILGRLGATLELTLSALLFASLGGIALGIAAARTRLGPHKLLGASCYSRLENAERAIAEGADHIAFGSFFVSSVKPGAVRSSPSLLTEAKRKFNLPVVAIGGITQANATPLIDAGADSVAVISALFNAPDIARAAREFNALFEKHHETKPKII